MRLILIFLSLLYSCTSIAQIETKVYGFNEYDFYADVHTDTAIVHKAGTPYVTYQVCDKNKTYKQFYKDKLVLKGELDRHRGLHGGFKKTGKWIEYYENGRIKCTGYYYKDMPIDKWTKYYSNGQLESEYSYAYMESKEGIRNNMAGIYRDYYDNGNLKTDGLYKQAVDSNLTDTIFMEDPITGETTIRIDTVSTPVSVKFGTWRYYSREGMLEKEEEIAD